MHGPQSTRRRKQTNRLKALTEVRESPGSGNAPPSDKPPICPTGCVALVLHEPELPRFVDSPCPRKWIGVHETGSAPVAGVGLERQCDARPGANRGTATTAEGNRYPRAHRGGCRGIVVVVAVAPARRKRHSYRAADGHRASTRRQRDAGPGAHSGYVRPAEAATQEAQGCNQKYLKGSFHTHAPFRENEPSATLSRPRPPSSHAPGVISHSWTPIYAQEEADQSVEGLDCGK